jgi:UDP-2,3-diacylglucosamine pyrophosphatase LpxH
MMPKIIVTSDQHLGYKNSDFQNFSNFLDYISNRNDVNSLILLGDLVDMWRRDVSGLFLIFSKVVNKLLDIKSSGKQVYLIAGNHDYHLLKLKAQDYPFDFLSNWTPLPSAESTAINDNTGTKIKYVFKHGWEFDLAQHPSIMEALCFNLSDTIGDQRTTIYSFLQNVKGKFDNVLKDIINFHGGNEEYLGHLLQPPEQRLQPYLTDVEKKAWSSVKQGETLIFGHTHRPFISKDHKVVNAGSWVVDAEVHDTFVEIDDEKLRLWNFKDKNTVNDITDNLTYPILP